MSRLMEDSELTARGAGERKAASVDFSPQDIATIADRIAHLDDQPFRRQMARFTYLLERARGNRRRQLKQIVEHATSRRKELMSDHSSTDTQQNDSAPVEATSIPTTDLAEQT